MNRHFKYFSLFLLFAICSQSISSRAQDTELADAQKAEKTMIGLMKKMNYWRLQKGKHNIDSLYAVNQRLRNFLTQHDNVDYMLSYDFKKLMAAGMKISSSTDSLCRTFLWNVTMTGPIHYRNAMLMYKANTFSSGTLYEKGSVVSDIQTLHTKKGQTIYLVHNENEYDLQNRYQGYFAYDIYDEYFEPKKFFYIGTDVQTSAGYHYDMSSFNKPYVKTQPISFSKDMKYLYIPIVLKDGAFEGDYLIYQFNGNEYHYLRAGKK